ncbi:hypothetical protein FB107DRAFT_266853, partial [Schizophyllum commune]
MVRTTISECRTLCYKTWRGACSFSTEPAQGFLLHLLNAQSTQHAHLHRVELTSTQLFLRGVTLAELAACLLEDRPCTPEYMRAEYLDQVMPPWNFDFSSNIALPSRALCDLVADTPVDPDGDIIQAIIHADVQAVNDPDVIAGVDLNEACVYGPFSVAGLEEPILLAMYSQPLPVSTIPEDVSRTAASAASAFQPSETEIRSAQRAISDAGRDRNCKLVHLCPICEKTYTRKSSLE